MQIRAGGYSTRFDEVPKDSKNPAAEEQHTEPDAQSAEQAALPEAGDEHFHAARFVVGIISNVLCGSDGQAVVKTTPHVGQNLACSRRSLWHWPHTRRVGAGVCPATCWAAACLTASAGTAGLGA